MAYVSKMPTRSAVTLVTTVKKVDWVINFSDSVSIIGVAEANAYSWGFYKNVESAPPGVYLKFMEILTSIDLFHFTKRRVSCTMMLSCQRNGSIKLSHCPAISRIIATSIKV